LADCTNGDEALDDISQDNDKGFLSNILQQLANVHQETVSSIKNTAERQMEHFVNSKQSDD